MRLIRLIFVVLIALFLIALALANRDMVTLSAFPANFGQFLGGQWTITLPLFLVIFVAFALGMIFGLVGEWLRESHIRRAAKDDAHRASRLETEVGDLRKEHAAPRDDVLAIVDRPKAAKAAEPLSIASAEPAPGTTLPPAR